MSKRYSFATLAALMAVFAAPAIADGYPDRQVQKGPPPLEAKALPPEQGCELLGGDDWYCPTERQADTRQHRDIHDTPPPPRHVVYRAPAARGLSIDISGFNGGVGAGVDGGYYGGGRSFAYARASASASALSSASARLTFRGGFKGGHKGKRKGAGCPGKCGS